MPLPCLHSLSAKLRPLLATPVPHMLTHVHQLGACARRYMKNLLSAIIEQARSHSSARPSVTPANVHHACSRKDTSLQLHSRCQR